MNDHEIAYPDIDGLDPNSAPAWLKTISITDGVVALDATQLEIAGRNNPTDDAAALKTAQRKYDNAGLDGLREFLYQKTLTDPEIDKAVKLATSDGDMARIAENLFELWEAKFPGEAKAAVGAKGLAKINARRKARGQIAL